MLSRSVRAGAALSVRCRMSTYDNGKPDFTYSGPSLDEVVALRKKHLTPAYFQYYTKPLMVVQGKRQYVWDQDGKRYLDMFGGIVTVSVGHSHPAVVSAGIEQMKRVMHTTTIYYNPEVSKYAEELARRLPPELSVIYFVNSGSEANDLACMMARLHTGHDDLIALRNAYHGMSMHTMGLTALSTWRFATQTGYGVHHALNPNPYRGPYGYNDAHAGEKYAADVADLISSVSPGNVAAFIAESIQGVGGTIVYPEGYLKRVYEIVRKAGGLCVADEVQTGFGRMGTHFWGFQQHGVMPDIVTMAKGIGNGIPLAAVATTPEIASVMSKKLHFNTYGANPLSCAIGRAVLRVIEEERLQENSRVVGDYFLKGLKELQSRHPIIGDVRGRGLMLGVELVRNPETKEPAKEETAKIFDRTREHGVLIGKGGLYGNIFRIKPPMIVSKKDVDFCLDAMHKSFVDVGL